MLLSDPIDELKGVGEKVGEKLRKLGIYTLKDMIEHYPREYEDRRVITPLASCEVDEPQNVLVTVCSKPQVAKKGSKIIVSFRVKDETSSIMVTFFGQAYMKNNFVMGEKYLLYGKLKHKYGQLEMDSPEYQKVGDPNNLSTVAKITPIYPATQKLSQKVIRGLIERCLDEVLPQVEEPLPERIIKQYHPIK